MDFNIKDYIQKIKNKSLNYPEKEKYLSIFNEYVFGLKSEDISFSQNVIFLKNISSVQKTKIKLHKKEILEKINKNNIGFRDIV